MTLGGQVHRRAPSHLTSQIYRSLPKISPASLRCMSRLASTTNCILLLFWLIDPRLLILGIRGLHLPLRRGISRQEICSRLPRRPHTHSNSSQHVPPESHA